jgi:hypothetical protein
MTFKTSDRSRLYRTDLLADCCYLPSNRQTIIALAAADRAADDISHALSNKLGIILQHATHAVMGSS